MNAQPVQRDWDIVDALLSRRGLYRFVDGLLADVEDAIAARRLDVSSERLVRQQLCRALAVTPIRDEPETDDAA